MNGGTRLSYYNYIIEVNILHIHFGVILHFDANLFYSFVYLFIYIIIIHLFVYLFIDLFIYSFFI